MMPRLNISILRTAVLGAFASMLTVAALPAQQAVTETRDPKQTQDEEFAEALHRVDDDGRIRQSARRPPAARLGIPTPKDVLGYYIGAPAKLTYYADILKYYRALARRRRA